MSIAVSAVVHPSRLLFSMVGGMSALVAGIGILVGAGCIGSAPPALLFSLGAATFFLALFGFYHGVRSGKTIQLDIYGTGLIRIAELGPEGTCAGRNRPHVRDSGEIVRLMSNSTLWPNMLLLRLQGDGGRATILPILPDCVDSDSFRAISVACRWIAAQGDESIHEPS